MASSAILESSFNRSDGFARFMQQLEHFERALHVVDLEQEAYERFERLLLAGFFSIIRS